MRNIANRVSQAFRKSGSHLVLAAFASVAIAGCAEDEVADGRVLNTIALPVDFILDLQCPEVGIGDEFCILDDPANPYARAAVNDSNKFDLHNNSPSAKSRFYLWGTVQAREPRGENQFYTALALHELYTQGNSVNARSQAKKAYRSVLDNYFDDVTFSEIRPDGSQDQFPLRNWVGDRLYNPGNFGYAQLFDSQADALANLEQWGYIYDVSSATVTTK